jgi:hypothetical protein
MHHEQRLQKPPKIHKHISTLRAVLIVNFKTREGKKRDEAANEQLYTELLIRGEAAGAGVMNRTGLQL